MKKILLFTAILFASITMVTGQTASDEATLTVRLHAIQSIVVNPIQKINFLDYITTDNYKDGVSLVREDHLTIFSTGAFIVQVASDVNEIQSVGSGIGTISASTIKIKAEKGSTQPLGGTTLGNISLSTTATNLISSSIGGVDKNFNITYSGLGANGYVNSYFNGENPTVYTTTVTYTITPS